MAASSRLLNCQRVLAAATVCGLSVNSCDRALSASRLADRKHAWQAPQGRCWGLLSAGLVLGCPALRCQDSSTTSSREFAYIHEHDFSPSMRDIAGKVDFIGLMEDGCWLLNGIGSEIIMKLSFGQKVFARKGTMLIEQGTENSAVFVVGHGTLSVTVHGVEVARAGAGEVVGLYTLLKKTKASASVTVTSEVAYFLELRHDHFMACLDDHPIVLERMKELQRQRDMQNRVAQTALHSGRMQELEKQHEIENRIAETVSRRSV
eukprot:TRINITY_DN35443_c0_g1_i1.p1 TRINITY_DN35443_c0_g1~~TRINITY_DN35443_c0_g1_i1.p1  ORF type:complete len:263 (-),score=44.89 TRINITY_DN35443_c0_g1_i1:109-897(-)